MIDFGRILRIRCVSRDTSAYQPRYVLKLLLVSSQSNAPDDNRVGRASLLRLILFPSFFFIYSPPPLCKRGAPAAATRSDVLLRRSLLDADQFLSSPPLSFSLQKIRNRERVTLPRLMEQRLDRDPRSALTAHACLVFLRDKTGQVLQRAATTFSRAAITPRVSHGVGGIRIQSRDNDEWTLEFAISRRIRLAISACRGN